LAGLASPGIARGASRRVTWLESRHPDQIPHFDICG
jgi:hypothetical protein